MRDGLRESATFGRHAIAEIQRAAREGIYDIRGAGAKRRVPHFDDLLFLGASMSRYPLEGYRERRATEVLLGARHARKPIELKIPVTIAGMSFGALSAQAKEALGRGASEVGTSTTTGDGGMTAEQREHSQTLDSQTLVDQVLPSRYGMNPDDLRRADAMLGGRRLANYLRTMTLELQTLARACGKSHVHNLEREDLAALTVEAAAMARVPLAGTNWIPGTRAGSHGAVQALWSPARAADRRSVPQSSSTGRSTHETTRGRGGPPRSTGSGPPRQPFRTPRARIGDIVVELGFCDREVVEEAVKQAAEAGEQIGQVLLGLGAITPDQLAMGLAKRFGLERRRLDEITIDHQAAQLISLAAARRRGAVPIGFDGDRALVVAVANPDNYLAVDDVSMFTGLQIKPVVVSHDDLDALIRRLTVIDGDLLEDQPLLEEVPLETVIESADDAPTIKLVRSIISDAVDRGVSDVHFAPDDGTLSVRYRIDGVMGDAARIPRAQADAVISRIKILAELDISERRLPQDGRMGIAIEGRRIDIRVALMPLVAGESAVLRILDSGRSPLSLDDLGMTLEDRARLERPLGRTHGAILVTSPTGSGKTTSLYAIIALVRSPEKTLTTIEDPVEYRLRGVNQIQVSERTGLTFAKGLRAIVRADPDVIMVGEVRDRESARIAVDAALTGHLVLTTLHTNDAPSSAMRLVDMGIEPYLISAALDCVIAQRLARRLCMSCRRPATVPAGHVGLEGGEIEVYEAAGCARCRGSGYRGRIGLFEVMLVTDEIRSQIVAGAAAHEIAAVAVAQGMRRLRDDGLAKVRASETTLAELARALG